MNEASQYYITNAYDFSQKTQMINEAKVGFLSEILHYYIKHFETELASSEEIKQQAKEHLENQLKELKLEAK